MRRSNLHRCGVYLGFRPTVMSCPFRYFAQPDYFIRSLHPTSNPTMTTMFNAAFWCTDKKVASCIRCHSRASLQLSLVMKVCIELPSRMAILSWCQRLQELAGCKNEWTTGRLGLTSSSRLVYRSTPARVRYSQVLGTFTETQYCLIGPVVDPQL